MFVSMCVCVCVCGGGGGGKDGRAGMFSGRDKFGN